MYVSGHGVRTRHISVMVSSNTPPASSAPSPSSFTFQARAGSRKSAAFRRTTWPDIWLNTGLHRLPLEHTLMHYWDYNTAYTAEKIMTVYMYLYMVVDEFVRRH